MSTCNNFTVSANLSVIEQCVACLSHNCGYCSTDSSSTSYCYSHGNQCSAKYNNPITGDTNECTVVTIFNPFSIIIVAFLILIAMFIAYCCARMRLTRLRNQQSMIDALTDLEPVECLAYNHNDVAHTDFVEAEPHYLNRYTTTHNQNIMDNEAVFIGIIDKSAITVHNDDKIITATAL